jgi:uncharacterized protein (PEP-CTERM system associated)
MRARPSSGGRRSSSKPSRRGVAKPQLGPVGAGLLAVLAGFPVLAQVGAFPPAEPAQEERLPPFETEPAPAATPPPPAGAPAAPASPFGTSPDIFPGIFGRPDRRIPEEPVVPSDPGVSTAPADAPVTPASPFGISPDIFPGIFGRPDQPRQEEPAEPGISRAPTDPEPDGAVAPELPAPPFLTPPSGFGLIPPTPFLPPQPVLPAAAAPLPTRLAPLRPGALPVQAFDRRAPPILIRPTASITGGYTDNPRSDPEGFSDVFARLNGNTAISFDTVRLQGQLSGGINYQKYARATTQDRLNANLLSYGLGTVVQDHIFIDARAAITQASRTGAFGFADPEVTRRSDLTHVITTSLTPIARQSFGGYVDGELRYNYGIVRSTQGGLLGDSDTDTVTTPTSLSGTTRNAATATLATGRLFTVFGSKLTLSATKIDSQSASRSKQFRAYDDLSYQFNQQFAALARIGYEKLEYPLQPAASTSGPAWAVGGRYTPFPGSYFSGTYGRQDGLMGFSGTLRYEITRRTIASASFQRNRASQQEQILNNLNASGVDASGTVVDPLSGLPTAIVNPGLSLTNAVSRYDTARVGLRTQLERDTLGLFAFLSRRAQLGTPVVATTTAADDTSKGIHFSWVRSLTPNLNSSAGLGFIIRDRNDQNTLTASLGMTYTLSERMSAILNYRFIDVDTAAVGGSYRRNQVEIGLRRSF